MKKLRQDAGQALFQAPYNLFHAVRQLGWKAQMGTHFSAQLFVYIDDPNVGAKYKLRGSFFLIVLYDGKKNGVISFSPGNIGLIGSDREFFSLASAYYKTVHHFENSCG